MAGDRGFEPRLADPESAVLPLDESPSQADYNIPALPRTSAVRSIEVARPCAPGPQRWRRGLSRPQERSGPRRSDQLVKVKQTLLPPGVTHDLFPEPFDPATGVRRGAVVDGRTSCLPTRGGLHIGAPTGPHQGIGQLLPHLPGDLVLLQAGQPSVKGKAKQLQSLIAPVARQSVEEGEHAVHRNVPGPALAYESLLPATVVGGRRDRGWAIPISPDSRSRTIPGPFEERPNRLAMPFSRPFWAQGWAPSSEEGKKRSRAWAKPTMRRRGWFWGLSRNVCHRLQSMGLTRRDSHRAGALDVPGTWSPAGSASPSGRSRGVLRPSSPAEPV